MEFKSPRFTLTLLLLAALAPLAHGQVSIEEAERRLKAKAATRPSTTQPVSELQRLHDENRRLLERISVLEQEVATLKDILARATHSTTGPATQPAPSPASEALAKTLVGRWRGGDITAGTGYILQFDPDGTYKQTFISVNSKEAGQYRIADDNTMEMWSDKWPENKRHNQYQIAITPIQLTLTPLVLDGLEVKKARPVVLRHAE